MKTKIPILVLVFCLSLLSTFSNAQGVWTQQYPANSTEPMENIFCLPNSTMAWGCGDLGFIMRTIDGNSWTSISTGTTNWLEGIYFVDKNIGWTVGQNGTILRSNNGGFSWFPQTSGTNVSLASVSFINQNTGWAVGQDVMAHTSTIVKTTDGGDTWTVQTLPGVTLRRIFFINSNIGWTIGDQGTNSIVMKTTDGGTNWTSQIISSIFDYDLTSLYMVDVLTGWIVGTNGKILKTADGGTTWVQQTSGVTNVLCGIFMIDVNTGWIVGDNGCVLKTSNSGTNWNVQTSGITNYLFNVSFSNANSGWIVGTGGLILGTVNGGATWTPLNGILPSYLQSIFFVDSRTGFTVGGSGGYLSWTSGVIMKTLDGGNTWNQLISSYTYGFNSTYFVNSSTGWVVGFNGTILKTTNGGSGWSIQTSGTTKNLLGVFFTDVNNGWAVGESGTILRTTNSGVTWTAQSSGTTNNCTGLYFVDLNHGWVVTSGGWMVLQTINGGASWTSTYVSGQTLNSVFFTNSSKGLCGGIGLYNTTNSGSSWSQINTPIKGYLYSIFFSDQNNGWAVGDQDIIKTLNGGTTWQSDLDPTGLGLKSVFFIKNSKTGWACGMSGIILHYSDFSPDIQAKNITATPTYQTILVQWERGNGNQSALFAKKTLNNSTSCLPFGNTTYLPNSIFSLGDQIKSTGWFCVYNGTGNSVTVSGLEASTDYTFQVCEYNFGPDFTHYNSTTATNNPITATTAIAPPQITGNPTDKALCETLNPTFSVTASGSGLSYQWQVNYGPGFVNVTDTLVYSGSHTNTLNLTWVPASYNSYKYHCVVSNTSGSATSNAAVLTVNPLPVVPSDISGTQIVCLNSSYPYTVPPVQFATSYAWTFPAGFSGTSTTNNINLTTSSNAVAGYIKINGINACGSGPIDSLLVSVRNLPANASQITGLNSVCTGSVNIGYNTATISDADYYVWSLPLGATGTSTTNSIMVSYGPSPVSDQITVKGHNICGDGIPGILPVSVNTVPEAIGTISGSSNLCKNQKGVLFSINAIPNATSYSWTLPQGLAGSNSTDSVSLDIGPDAFSGDVKVSGVNSCGIGAEIVFPVIVDAAPDPAGPITGPAKVCSGETNVQYSIPKSEKATSYIWSLPDGTSETTIANKIALNFDNNTISGNLAVSPANSCGSGNSKSLFIDVTVPSKPEITSDNYKAGSCLEDTPLKLSVKEALPGYNYLWSKNGALITSDTSSFLEGYLSSGDYTVEADLEGCTSQSEIFKVLFSDAPEKPVIYSKGPTVWYLACSNENAPHYKWYYNGNIIPGADNYVYVAAQNLGKYFVLVGNASGCFTASDEVTIPPIITGINDIDLNTGTKIYPNPTTGKLTIEMNNKLFGDLKIDILNQEGKVLSSEKIKKSTEGLIEQTDLSALSKGIYYIHFIINDFSSFQKIIIE